MKVEPKVRGFICTTAHPEGCRQHVRQMIDYVEAQMPLVGPKRVLVIGASTGYGLGARIATAFGASTATLGVMFERPGTAKRTASAGWYNTQAFEAEAHKRQLYAKTINGDAFQPETKQAVIETLRRDLGSIDLLIYSVAAPRRKGPEGELWESVIKPVGGSFTGKTLDLSQNEVKEIRVEAATEQEVEATIKVMGGEDWAAWVDALAEAKLLADGCQTLAFSYIGPGITHAIYRSGSIGKAKEDLDRTAVLLRERYRDLGLNARVAVNKALVTQASAAIPSVPLYITLLYQVMKKAQKHEGYGEQMYRLLVDKLYTAKPVYDEEGRLRVDDYEMEPEIQNEVLSRWQQVSTENIGILGDIEGYWSDFYELFGFGVPGVDYEADFDLEAENHYPGSTLEA